ncbi:MAG: SDR family oxidoreductase [Bacteroidetes bacterium]|nr:SDR family oxidoreductase [Bacteroidota bacterium]
MKILVTGSNGLLGQKLVYALMHRKDITLIACARGENRIHLKEGYIYESVDLNNPQRVEEIIHSHQPHCIIHTAAMTNVDACELDPPGCRMNNVDTVNYLLLAAKKHNSHFIYISTDFVFDGASGPYRETDPIGPLSVYAQSKADAEQLVMDSGLPWTILRTMIIYGVTDDTQRSNVVLWTKKSLEAGTDINVINDQYRGPTLAEDLAEACITAAMTTTEGLFHVSGKEVLSILDIAYKIADHFGLDKKYIHPITTDSLKQPALRPLKTGFIIDKATKELNFHPHTLEEGLKIVEEQLSKKQVI